MNTVPCIPIVFGHWLVDGNKLVCRLPRKTVSVNAPKKLIGAVLQLCDGSRPWSEVITTLSADWQPSSIIAFMSSLVQDGLLVEASLLWAHWIDIAQLPVLTAVATSPKEIGQLHQVAERRLLSGRGGGTQDVLEGENKFAQLLAKRQSTRTFDDKPISAECLCSILWAAHGVTCAEQSKSVRWRRTIASGGNMHSARWFVAVLRDLPVRDKLGKPLPAGIYEARFHKLGGASLQQTKDQSNKHATEAWRCLRDPRVLRFASALVFPVYDVAVPGKKYGNRATLYAVMEAGQALQNAQLMAFDLGASGMLRGDTLSHESLSMLGLKNDAEHWLSLPAMVVGSHPTLDQIKAQQQDDALRIAPNLRLSKNSFAFASSSAVDDDNTDFAGSGRSPDPKLALTKAEAEYWERFAWSNPVDIRSTNFRVGHLSEVEGAVDPNTLTAYSERQYFRQDFPFKPFSSRRQYLWANATDVESGQPKMVIADCVYASSALPLRFKRSLFTNSSTSGMAAGISHDDALCRATLELIERDAFLRAWLSRCAPPAIKTVSLPGSAALRVTALMQLGFKVVVSDISTAWASVISVFAQSDQLPFTAITAASNFSAEAALDKALDEMEGRISHAQHFAIPESDGQYPPRQIERYYRHRATYKKSDFYIEGARPVSFASTAAERVQNWEELQSRISRDGSRLLTVNMTPEHARVEQGRVPLHVVRAIIPGLLPIWFEFPLQPERLQKPSGFGGSMWWPTADRFFIHPFT